MVIPNSVTSIGDRAFDDCKGLTSVVIPNSVTSIGNGAFSGCYRLASVVIPNSVTSIGEEAFWGCFGLASVVIPNSYISIGKEAFYNCDRLTSVVIPYCVSSIGKEAFSHCDNLGSVFVLAPYPIGEGSTDYDSVLRRGINLGIKGWLFFKVINNNQKEGILRFDGKWIVPIDKDYTNISVLGDRYIKVSKNGHYGIINLDGKEVIPISRGYKSIGDYNSAKGTFAFTRRGMKGICNMQGKEISTTRCAWTKDEIKSSGGFSSVAAMYDGPLKYYKVTKGSRCGLTDRYGKIVVPVEMDALESAGDRYLRYKLNGFWGLMNYQGKILIDTNRGYTSIGDYKSFSKRFVYTMSGYKGECDAAGRQISKIKVETPKQQTASSSSSSSSSNSSSNSNTGNNTQTIHVQHHRDPVPVQVWIQCNICYGSGICQIINCNNGWNYGTRMACLGCGGSGRCGICAGQGGHYEVQYR